MTDRTQEPADPRAAPSSGSETPAGEPGEAHGGDAELAARLDEAQRRVAELEALTRRAAVLDELIARLPDGCALIGPDSAQLDVNDALCAMTGFSREELVGAAAPYPFWPPEERAAIEAAYDAARHGETHTQELTFMRKDGERFPVQVTPTTVRDETGAMRLGMATFKDVSGLRHAEAALQRSETDLRTLGDNIDDVVVRYDLDLRFAYVNPAVGRMPVPKRLEDMIGRTNLEAGFPPDLAGRFDDALRRCLTTLEPVTIEYRMQGPAGESVGESRIYPELDHEGRPVALMAISRDVTARSRADAALRESEEKYRAVVERAGDAVIIMDAERFLFGNPMAAHQSGYTIDELVGLPIAAVLPEESRARLLDRARRRLTGEDLPTTYTADLLRRDGSRFTAEISAGVIHYEGAPAELLIVRDVTAREAAAERLRRSEAMRDSAERVAGVGSYRWDLTTQGVTYSPEMFRLFDVDPGSFDGSFLSVVETRVHDDDRADLLARIADFEERGTIGPHEFRVVHRDGTVRVLHGEADLEREAKGQPLAIVGYYRDVTAERHAEEEIRRLNAELEERVATRTAQRDALNHELEALAYSASHELRAPLRAIDGFSAIVVEDAAERLSAEDLEHLGRVRAAARRMTELIDDLLGLSRISRRDLVRTTVDVSGMAGEVAAELGAEHPDRRVEVLIAPALSAHADAALLRIILYELLDNAWKFSVARDPAHVEVGVVAEGGRSGFYVRDDGVGYDPRFAEHLFGAFQRLHPAGEYPGNGIGLATVQRLVAHHGGTVWAHGEVEQGATFYVSLPEEQDEPA